MQHFEYSIDVNIPVRVAYEQWIRFEEFPSFMPTVKHVVQRDDKTLDVTSTLAGMRADWTAEITDQTPDARIAWKSTSGSGSEYTTTILLQPLGESRTRVTMKAEVDPKGRVETVAMKLLGRPFLERRVKGDLAGLNSSSSRVASSRSGPGFGQQAVEGVAERIARTVHTHNRL